MANPRKPSALKAIAGTNQKCRDAAVANSVEMPPLSNIPDAPDWLPNAHAVKEWNRLAPILTNNKLLTEAGLSALALLCSLHGKCVQLFAAGECPTGHMVAQCRNLMNDFGLTPVAQGKVKAVSGDKEKPNKFANNIKRAT